MKFTNQRATLGVSLSTYYSLLLSRAPGEGTGQCLIILFFFFFLKLLVRSLSTKGQNEKWKVPVLLWLKGCRIHFLLAQETWTTENSMCFLATSPCIVNKTKFNEQANQYNVHHTKLWGNVSHRGYCELSSKNWTLGNLHKFLYAKFRYTTSSRNSELKRSVYVFKRTRRKSSTS